jgi:hypothetical protein
VTGPFVELTATHMGDLSAGTKVVVNMANLLAVFRQQDAGFTQVELVGDVRYHVEELPNEIIVKAQV